MRRMWDLAEWLILVGGCLVLLLLWSTPPTAIEASVQAQVEGQSAAADSAQTSDQRSADSPQQKTLLGTDEDDAKPGEKEASAEPLADEGDESRVWPGDPQTVADLKALQTRVQACVQAVSKATVGVEIGQAQGSGVIVSRDGMVLTAAHVSGQPGRLATVILPDGRRLRAKTLGGNETLDASLIQITSRGQWDFAEMGDSERVDPGQWCVSLGHPGGYLRGRPPVVRVGRVVSRRRSVIQTDCALVGGDSGGPLFDLDGRVIGIHSRIGAATDWNFHVPVGAYRENWERLANSENWGTPTEATSTSKAWLGITGSTQDSTCRVERVVEGTPAENAGLQVGDVITRFGNNRVTGIESLIRLVGQKKAGEEVILEFERDGTRRQVKVVLGELP